MANSKIFILSAIDIHKRDDKRWRKLFEICKVQHPVWEKKTLNEYKEFEIGWGRLYDIYDFNAAYFIDKDKAIEYAEANMADINESGAYPYIAIIPRCINLMYQNLVKKISRSLNMTIQLINTILSKLMTMNMLCQSSSITHYNPYPLSQKKG